MKKNSKKKNSRIWAMVGLCALVGCLICGIYIAGYYRDRQQSERKYAAIRQEMEEEGTPEPQNSAVTLEEIEQTEFTGELDGPAPVIPEGVLNEAENHPVDFARLQEINPELYAWIRIPNTQIDYPVAQYAGEDQTFYLHHDMYKEPQFAGCIYSENSNGTDFMDPVTVLYGHNMKNGSMFQNLSFFRNSEFFDENEYVYIYLPEKILVYQIYAAYPYDDRNIMNSFNFTKAEEVEKYRKESLQPHSMEAKVREGVTLSEDSRILTLSTCIANQTDQRYLVQAVLLYEKDGE